MDWADMLQSTACAIHSIMSDGSHSQLYRTTASLVEGNERVLQVLRPWALVLGRQANIPSTKRNCGVQRSDKKLTRDGFVNTLTVRSCPLVTPLSATRTKRTGILSNRIRLPNTRERSQITIADLSSPPGRYKSRQ